MTIRVLITIALLHPLSNMANVIYYKLVRPFLSQHEKHIDEKIDELAKQGKKKIVEGAEQVFTSIWFAYIYKN